MNRTRALILAAVILAVGVGGTWEVTRAKDTSTPDPRAAVVTSLGVTPPTGEPDLPGFTTARPARGTVGHVQGPFDDRYELRRLALTPTAVTGELEVTSDVSDLLELEVVAAFYDASGAVLGKSRYVHHLDDHSEAHTGPPDESQAFRIDIPTALRGTVVSAAVGVPVLVNE